MKAEQTAKSEDRATDAGIVGNAMSSNRSAIVPDVGWSFSNRIVNVIRFIALQNQARSIVSSKRNGVWNVRRQKPIIFVIRPKHARREKRVKNSGSVRVQIRKPLASAVTDWVAINQPSARHARFNVRPVCHPKIPIFLKIRDIKGEGLRSEYGECAEKREHGFFHRVF